jgi:biopolymer transport protein ExbD
MARNFRRHRSGHAIADLNVTNLIDLAFMLLIIFMVATPLIQQEQQIPVNLPVESPSPQPKVDPKDKFEAITIRAGGQLLLGDQAITLRRLASELERFANQPKPPVIRLRIDAEATGQHFVSVMDELKKHNLTRWTIDTQTSR